MEKMIGGIERDDTGRLQIVPLKLPASTYCRPEKSSEKKDVKKPFIPIAPLGPLIFESAHRDTDKSAQRRISKSKSVRKELFRVPPTKVERRYSKLPARKSLNGIKTNTSKKRISKIISTPLTKLEELEELYNCKPSLVQVKLFEPSESENEETEITKVETPSKENVANNGISSDGSDLEFLQNEKKCASVQKNRKKKTPQMRSVGKSTQNGKIIPNDINSVLTAIIKEDMDQFEILQQQFHTFQEEHQKRMNSLMDLLSSSSQDKENINTTPTTSSRGKGKRNFMSPLTALNGDLRKVTLTKNFSQGLKCDSPKMIKAVELYNSFRSNCTSLLTPQIDKTKLNQPRGSVTRSLSRRIQKQCLLLQETPR